MLIEPCVPYQQNNHITIWIHKLSVVYDEIWDNMNGSIKSQDQYCDNHVMVFFYEKVPFETTFYSVSKTPHDVI